MNKKLSYLLSLLLLGSTAANALTLKEAVTKVLNENPEVAAQLKNQKAFKKYIDEREGGYLPSIDLNARAEISNTDQNFKDSTPDGSIQEDGYNVGLTLNQLLYDGGLTPALIKEAEFNDSANKFRSENEIDTVILSTVNAYTSVAQLNERLNLTDDMIKINQTNLISAQQKANISGEIKETYQVQSKLSFLQEKLYEEQSLKTSGISTFYRFVGQEPDGNECRPQINTGIVPPSIDDALRFAVNKNFGIKEQIEKIKSQREKIAQQDATFLPNLNLELNISRDNDLSLDENGDENQAYARVNLAWNLYNGGSDRAVTEQQKLFLSEQKKRLDGITRKVAESVKIDYDRYETIQKRIKALKSYVTANEKIVQIYKSEFEAGTRTFVDILDAQTILYEAKKNLIIREYDLIDAYYALMKDFSIIRESILDSTNNCAKPSVETRLVSSIENQMMTMPEVVSDDVLSMLQEETKKEEVITGLYQDLMTEFRDDFARWDAELDKDGLIFRFANASALFPSEEYYLSRKYQNILKDFYPRYVKVISKYKNQIADVRVEGHASSVYKLAKSKAEAYEYNRKLSLNRAKSVRWFTINLEDQIVQNDRKWLEENYKAYGLSSDYTIKKPDGTEDYNRSRRVEFRINKIIK